MKLKIKISDKQFLFWSFTLSFSVEFICLPHGEHSDPEMRICSGHKFSTSKLAHGAASNGLPMVCM
jgi:hypothetical protein